MNKNNENDLLTKIMWSASLLSAGLLSTSTAWGHSGGYNDWHMGRWMMGGWGMGWFGMILMLIFWGLVLAGIVLLIKWLVQTKAGRERSGLNTGSNAMEILKERYARGEINRDEFESIKKDLFQ